MAENKVKTMLSGIHLAFGHLIEEYRSKILDVCFECPARVIYLTQRCSGHSGIFVY